MTPRRFKATTILAGLAASGLALIAWTQPWFGIRLDDGTGLEVGGDVAAPAVPALALAGLALFGALSLAGGVFRVILGVLAAVLGVCVLLSAGSAIVDPVGASAPAITDATAVAGDAAVAGLVATIAPTAWPAVAAFAGAVLIALGAILLLGRRRWPAAQRRYSSVRLASENGDPVGSWDELSEGGDPTGDKI